nr:hypothetical protein [Mucilaginibacter sp. SP1R1]
MTVNKRQLRTNRRQLKTAGAVNKKNRCEQLVHSGFFYLSGNMIIS